MRQCVAEAAAAFHTDVVTCARDARRARRDCRAKVRACVADCGTAVEPCDAAVRAARRDAIGTCTRTHGDTVAACHVAFPRAGAGLKRCIARAKGEGAVCRNDARLAARQAFLACRLTLGSCVTACPNQ